MLFQRQDGSALKRSGPVLAQTTLEALHVERTVQETAAKRQLSQTK
jgi:hypothetical protein